MKPTLRNLLATAAVLAVATCAQACMLVLERGTTSPVIVAQFPIFDDGTIVFNQGTLTENSTSTPAPGELVMEKGGVRKLWSVNNVVNISSTNTSASTAGGIVFQNNGPTNGATVYLSANGELFTKESGLVSRERYLDDYTIEENISAGSYTKSAYLDFGDGRIDASEVYYYAKDHLGTTRCTFARSNGSLIESGRYAAYGERTPIAYTTPVARLNYTAAGELPTKDAFTGKEFDDEGKISDGMSGMRLSYFGARYYDAEIGVWTSTDPAEQYWSAYSYASNGTNPIGGIDFDGLTLYVCSATNALGIPGANHAYVWSTVANNGVGMHGSQAFGMQTMTPGNGAENPFDEFGNLKPGIKVKEVDLQGRDESEVFNKMNDWPGWNKTPWNPTGAHPGDCHAELEGAFIDAGVKYPGAPNGRLDWNDAFNSGLRGMQGWEQNVSGGLVNPPVWPVYVKGGITPFGLYKALGTAELNAAVLSVSAVAALASNMAITIGLGAASVGPACVGVATGQGIQWLGGIIPAVIP